MHRSQLSPRSFPTPRFTPSASAGLSNGHVERLAAAGKATSTAKGGGGGVGGSGEGDMLTTPNPYDSFPPSATGADFPMKGGVESTPPPEPQEPPRDLPFNSELGLRSPCDGLLFKRRKQFKDSKQVSSNSAGDRSDSNSCDTPTSSQNSPRDMTMKASGEGAAATSPTSLTAPSIPTSTISSGSSSSSASSSSTSRVQVKLEFPDSSSSAARSPTAAAVRSPFQSKAEADSAGFKHPSRGRPSAVAAVAAAAAAAAAAEGAPSQAHVTPSPLALVPSPNLSAIERHFGSALLKTPKLLDGRTDIFDFIPERANLPSLTGGGGGSSLSSSRSPGCCDVSGRDQLPRSPRFSIPEAPTDLSNKSPAAASTGSSSSSNAASQQSMMQDPPPYPSEAEDLSVNSSRSMKADASPSPPQTTATHAGQPAMQQPPQLLTLKQEYIDPAGSRYYHQTDRPSYWLFR